MTVLLQTREQLVQQKHLATVHNETFEAFFTRVCDSLGAREEEWVVAGLLELHSNVHQGDLSILGHQGGVVAGQDVLVPPSLYIQAQLGCWTMHEKAKCSYLEM